jgi:hypothetical protein
MKIIDLEELKPEIQKVKFKTMRKGIAKRKEYVLDIIYNSATMVVQQKYAKKPEKLDIETVSAVAMATYDFMTVDWFNDNVGQDDISNIYLVIMYNHKYSRDKAIELTYNKVEKKKIVPSFLARLFQR